MTATEPHCVNIIGMGMSPDDLTAKHLEMITTAEVLFGGRRHLASFPDITARRVEIDRNLEAIAAIIRREMASRRVVVLASGDPLYFGIGAYLIRTLGRENVCIWPNVTTVAAAFARIGRPWHDAVVISLHGRPEEYPLQAALRQSAHLAVFTDRRHSPAWLGGQLAKHGHDDARLCVLERLGYADESVRWFTPQEIGAETFLEPNLVIIETGHQGHNERPYLGLPETRIKHERGLITKSEVRAVSLSKLQIKPGMTFWDLGSGSGAVAIEASCLAAGGMVYAVEKNMERAARIRVNCRECGAVGVNVVEADLPAGMDELPDPDRIFLGGGGRALAEIILNAVDRMKKDGIMVANTVLIESMQTAVKTMRDKGLQTDVTQIQISRSRPMPAGNRMEALNPVWVVRGRLIA